MLNKNTDLPLELIIEFQSLIKVMSKRNDPEKDVVQVMDFLNSDIEDMEVGYNYLKRVFTIAIAKKKSEDTKVIATPAVQNNFIDQFDKKAMMSKINIVRLCGKSEAWIYKHIDNFDHSSKGVYVKSFLQWLQVYNTDYYNTFRENFAQ